MLNVNSPAPYTGTGDQPGRNLYRELAPPPHLDPFLECIWESHALAENPGYLVMPDGCMDVLWVEEDKPEIVGTMTRSVRVPLQRGERVRGVRFRPGMMNLCLPIAAAELVNGRVDSRDYGLRRLPFKQFLESLRPQSITPVHRALAHAAKSIKPVPLDSLIEDTGLSPRQFRRQCIAATGVSPKHLLRILRFRQASLAAICGQARWADLAAEFGYFDQAHLIREFREFTGHSPTSLVSVFSNTSAP
jgi:AraC-like DNA-binding protein